VRGGCLGFSLSDMAFWFFVFSQFVPFYQSFHARSYAICREIE
jgi:hypothetical protein